MVKGPFKFKKIDLKSRRKFTLKAIFVPFELLSLLKWDYAPVLFDKVYIVAVYCDIGSSSRFVLCVRFTMDVHAIGNEIQFVNGGKFECALEFWPTIMKFKIMWYTFLFDSNMWIYVFSLQTYKHTICDIIPNIITINRQCIEKCDRNYKS